MCCRSRLVGEVVLLLSISGIGRGCKRLRTVNIEDKYSLLIPHHGFVPIFIIYP